MNINEARRWAGLPTRNSDMKLRELLQEKKAPDDAETTEVPSDDAAPAPSASEDVPSAITKFVTSGLAKKLVKAGLATDPGEDEGASLIAIVTPFYDAGFKAGKAAK